MTSEETFDYAKSFSLEKVLSQAKWYYEDLEKGGWREIQKEENKSTFWVKSFPQEEIPLKFLWKVHVPLSVEQFFEVMNPKNMKLRRKWDKAFADNEVLEEYPDGGGYLVYNRLEMPKPFTDREFILFTAAAKEVDWYGQRAFLTPYLNATHPSKPANASRYVRATNGGQFSLVTADENDPDNACTVFCLSHNLYNGRIPSKRVEWMFTRAVPKRFIQLYNNVVEGYKMFFVDKDKNEQHE